MYFDSKGGRGICKLLSAGARVALCLLISACGNGSQSSTTSSGPVTPMNPDSSPSPSAGTGAAADKGVNYITGYGIPALMSAEANTSQITLDMQQIEQLNARWVRIETYMPQNGATNDPTVNLPNFVDAVENAGMQPILDILQWQYPPSARSAYQTWLAGLLAGAAQNVSVFEIGDEPNLNVYTESGGAYDPQTGQYSLPYAGFDVEDQPYGWNIPENLVDPGSSDPNQYLGSCPAGDISAYQAAVTQYVQFLSDSYETIKRMKPDSTVIVGGISSYQAVCFLQVLGQQQAYLYADAIGWHPYPVGPSTDPPPLQTPQRGANSIAILTQAMSQWPRQLPIWITEYGFQSPNNYASYDDGYGNAVMNEAVKAQDIADQYMIMRTQTQISGPIVLYTATDNARTATQWASQDSSGNEGGWGLFEFCYPDQSSNSCPGSQPLKVNPAFDSFKNLN